MVSRPLRRHSLIAAIADATRLPIQADGHVARRPKTALVGLAFYRLRARPPTRGVHGNTASEIFSRGMRGAELHARGEAMQRRTTIVERSPSKA